jgi:hypothetical protein
MAAGRTHIQDLNDSIPTIIAAARIVREFEGVMVRLSDRTNLSEGTGDKWNEISLAKLTAQGITETTQLDNPQKLQDTLFTVEPTIVGVQTIITDKTMRRISKKVAAKIGQLAQSAIQRKKDADGLTLLDSATTSLGGAGTTMHDGLVSSAMARITGNTTERGVGSLYTVLHPFQLKDVQDQITTGIGTYAVPSGITEEFFRRGFTGTLYNTEVFTAGNLTIDGSDDTKGGTFAREAVVLVDGFGPKVETDRLIRYGGGANELIVYDEYAYGERSAGNWLYELYTDATAPTA